MKNIKAYIIDHFEGAIIALVIIGVFTIAFIVYYKFSFLNFFFLPVVLSAFFLGKNKAVLVGILCVLLVVFYLIFLNISSSQKQELSFADVSVLVTWAGFLIVTAGVIGALAEQREGKLEKLKRSYVAVLDILLKYQEVVDETKPNLRVSLLAGKIAKNAQLAPAEVEDIKTAALLYEAGDLQSSLPLFEEVAEFMKSDRIISEMGDREIALLKTTLSLFKKIEPLLSSYFNHYVKQAEVLDKDLEKIPMGSSILALADIYDRISTQIPTYLGGQEIKSLEDIKKLAGRTFHETAVNTLQELIST